MLEFGHYEFKAGGREVCTYPALRPEWSRVYTEGKDKVSPGFVLKQPDLARTLEALAQEGPGLLYGGALGQKIVDRLAELAAACLTMEDLRAVKPTWVGPGVSLLSRPHGERAAAALRGLPVHPDAAHPRGLRPWQDENATRRSMSTPCCAPSAWPRACASPPGVPSPQKLAEILSDGHVEQLRARVRDGKQIVGPTEQWTPPGKPETIKDSHTTSFSITDSEGNVICLTQSLGSAFGSGVVVPGTGLCLNNFLYWADVNPASPNRVTPGGPLPMCMAPSIVTKDDVPVLALGTPGSYGILQTQPQALVQYLDFGQPLQQAIEAPRARLNDGTEVMLEARFEPEVPGRAAQARPRRGRGSRLDDEGGRHAGRGDQSRDRRLHRRLRSAARRLLRARLAYFFGRDGSEISATAAPTLPRAAARGSVAMSPSATMPFSDLSRSSTTSRRT